MESFQRRAQPIGGDRDDRTGAAPCGELEGDPGTQGIPSDVELSDAKPFQLALNGIRQRRGRRRDP